MQDESLNSLLHMPVEETDENVFSFRFSPQCDSVDLVQNQHGLQSTDPQSQASLKDSVWPGWVVNLPLVGISLRTVEPSGAQAETTSGEDGVRHACSDTMIFCGSAPLQNESGEDAEKAPKSCVESVLVDASALIAEAFFVTGIDSSQILSKPRVVTSDIRLFPTNARVPVQYQITMDHMDPSSVTSHEIHFSLVQLPHTPMVGRRADDRVGYFTSTYLDIGVHDHGTGTPVPPLHRLTDAVDRKTSLIHRRRITRYRSFLP
jgi:hypothetical protein